MNTQRPEWNDANNALVGNGVSMVTLYYLNRFFNFFEELLESSSTTEVEVSNEILEFFDKVLNTFEKNTKWLPAQKPTVAPQRCPPKLNNWPFQGAPTLTDTNFRTNMPAQGPTH